MAFCDTLLTWFEENKRSLPWRGEQDPYKIWISEIILQQTRVQQGWDYYLRFIETFPDVKSLAGATEDQVLRLWQGLGYYSRARNLHYAAKQIMLEHNGHFPSQYDDIRKLKGVGDYTAAAISSIAFAQPYPAVDGNVMRIISRIFGICEDISLPATKSKITQICQKEISADQPGSFNQACMEFGAIWCTPRTPQCSDCPFRLQCYAFQHQLVETLPIKNKSIKKRERFLHFIFYTNNKYTIIEKRTGKDIWHNMYQFPCMETANDEPLEGMECAIMIRETLTHQIIKARFYIQNVDKLPKCSTHQQIVKPDEMELFPMPKIMTQFLKDCELNNPE